MNMFFGTTELVRAKGFAMLEQGECKISYVKL